MRTSANVNRGSSILRLAAHVSRRTLTALPFLPKKIVDLAEHNAVQRKHLEHAATSLRFRSPPNSIPRHVSVPAIPKESSLRL